MATGRGIQIVIQGDGDSAKKALEMVRENLKETGEVAKHEASQISESMEMVTHALERVGLYMGIREAIDLMKEMVAGSVELGMEIGHLSQQTGISAENLSVLKFASDETGVSFESLTKGFKRLSTEYANANAGNKEAQANFHKLGISMEEVRSLGLDTYGLLALMADKFKAMPDGMEKSALAITFFGKAGMQLIPFLNKGSDGITELTQKAEELGVKLNGEMVESLENVHSAGIEATTAWHGFALELTETASPAIVAATNYMKDLLEAMRGHPGALLAPDDSEIGKWTKDQEARISEMYHRAVDKGLKLLPPGWEKLVNGNDDHAPQEAPKPAPVADPKSLAEAQMDSAETHLLQARVAFATKSNAASLALVKKASAEMLAALEAEHASGLIDEQKYLEKKLQLIEASNRDTKAANKPEKINDGAARAAAELAEEKATAQAAAIKSGNALLLAQIEAGHKMFLISDHDLYEDQAILAKANADAEIAADESKAATLRAQKATQHAALLKAKTPEAKDHAGAEELHTETELLKVEEKITEAKNKRAAIDPARAAADQERAANVELATAKMAAEIEAETNTSISARLALLRLELQIEQQKIAATAGTHSPEFAQAAALEKIKETKLQIADVDRQIIAIEQDNTRAVRELADAAAKDPRFKDAAQKQINALNKQEAQDLKALVAQYDALAQELGGPFTQKAKDLHAELDKLNRPTDKDPAQFAKTLTEGIESMATQMAEATGRGKDSFHQMAQSIEQDIIRLAAKLAMQKWLTPLLMGIGGKGGGAPASTNDNYDFTSVLGFADGGDPPTDRPSMVGENGPELFFPKGPGTVTPNSMLSQISEGGGGKAPNVTLNVTNASSQPVTARTTGTSFDSDMKQFIIHTVLEDHASGGPISQANQ
jgi:hypothetical protein